MEKTFTIGTLASSAGVNVQTVRYYERRGLLPPLRRNTSGYRLYDEGAVRILRFILRAKELGFTLVEIKELLSLSVSSPASCDRVRDKALYKLRVVEGKLKALNSVRDVLRELITACDNQRFTEECPILRVLEGE